MNDPSIPLSEAQAPEGAPASGSDAPSFTAYTHFPQVEALLERHLGEGARVTLPGNWRDGFMRYWPWFTLAFLPMHGLLVLTLLGISAVGFLFGHVSMLSGLFSLAIFVLYAMAIPGLFKRERAGWTLYSYGLAIGAFDDLLRLSLFGIAMHALLFWFVFQVKYRFR